MPHTGYSPSGFPVTEIRYWVRCLEQQYRRGKAHAWRPWKGLGHFFLAGSVSWSDFLRICCFLGYDFFGLFVFLCVCVCFVGGDRFFFFF